MFEIAVGREEADFTHTPDGIVELLDRVCSDHDIDFDRQELVGQPSSLLNRIHGYHHRFSIKSQSGSYRVIEKHCTGIGDHLSYAAFITGLVYMGIYPRPRTPSLQALLILGILVVISFGRLFELFQRTSVLLLLTHQSKNYTKYYPLQNVSRLPALAAAGVGLLLIELGLMPWPTTYFAALSLLSLLAHELVVLLGALQGRALRISSPNVFSSFSFELVEVMVFVALPSLFAIVIVDPGDFQGIGSSPWFLPYLLWIGVAIFFVVVASTIYYLYRYAAYGRRPAYTDFKEDLRTPSTAGEQLLTLASAVIASYGTAFLGHRVFIEYLSAGLSPGLTVVMIGIFALLPMSYLFLGLLYQAQTYISALSTLFRSSEHQELELPLDNHARIRVIDEHAPISDDHASSFSTGFNDVIFLAEPLLKELNGQELAAVVAHEQFHIENQDALLSFWTPLVSTILLLGRNIIYGLLDYRSRELAADREAAERVGAKNLINAFEKIQELNEDENDPGVPVPSFAPFSGYLFRNSGFSGYFQMFFGTFALQQAHPSFEERINTVQDLGQATTEY